MCLPPQLVDAGRGVSGRCWPPGLHGRQAVTAVSFHRLKPGLLLAAGADGTVSVYSPAAASPVASLTGTARLGGRRGARGGPSSCADTPLPSAPRPEQANEINALDVCRDGSAFATAGKDRHIRLYDSHTHQVSRWAARGGGGGAGPAAHRLGFSFLFPPEALPRHGGPRLHGRRRVHAPQRPFPADLCLVLPPHGTAPLSDGGLGQLGQSEQLRRAGVLDPGPSRAQALPGGVAFLSAGHALRSLLFSLSALQVWDKRVSKGAQGMLNGPHICGPGIDVKVRRKCLSRSRTALAPRPPGQLTRPFPSMLSLQQPRVLERTEGGGLACFPTAFGWLSYLGPLGLPSCMSCVTGNNSCFRFGVG